VTVRLRVEDAAGQEGWTQAVPMVLPERRFSHPVAQAVADLRRALVLGPERARAVAGGLHALADDPAAYDDRMAVFLSLKAAAARLALAPDGLARDGDLAPLWSIALALEDGNLALARRSLEDAREALREAVETGAPAEEIQRRVEAVREALAQVMESLAESMPLAELPPMARLPEGSQMMRPDDLSRMMDELAMLSDMGAQDAARALLDQLDQMLEQLQSARPPTAQELQAMAEMAEMANRLRDLVERQQALLDETFAQDPNAADDGVNRADPLTEESLSRLLEGLSSLEERPGMGDGLPPPFSLGPPPHMAEGNDPQLESPPGAEGEAAQGQPSGPSDEVTRDLEARQRALRGLLEALMADLGDRLDAVPESLGEANLAMRDAEQALSEGDIGAATRAQGRALEALRQGGQKAMAGMAKQMGLSMLSLGMPGMPGGPPGMGSGWGRGWGQGRDPLNRPLGGATEADEVDLPTEMESRRAREILRELRRRANDAARPAPERDYLDRLIEAF